MVLTFAGSSHSKYTNYVLEMICDLELESSIEFREAFLANWIINPCGEPGRFVAGDKFQEQLQDEMYEHIGRKDRGFDENYMRKVIAPNAYRFVLIKKAVSEGIGLTKKGGKHTEPHTKPEMRTLMSVYQSEQLHLFRRGRTYSEDDLRKVDDLGRGATKLAGGKLESWVLETMRARLSIPNMDAADNSNEVDRLEMGNFDRLDAEIQENQQTNEEWTRGNIVDADGELMFEYSNDNNDGDEAEGLEETDG